VKRIFIHIGMHKTGSTSIQHSFSRFKQEGIRYLQLGNSNHSAVHATLFLQEPEKYPAHKRNGRSLQDVRELRSFFLDRVKQELATAKDECFITSGEDISIMDEGSLARMRDFFLEYCDNITIVGYVRPPGSLMASALQQRLVGGQSVKIESLYPEYEARFSKFDRVFGRNNVILKKFDKGYLESANVVIDFAKIIGVSIPESVIALSNEGRGLEVAALLYTYRYFIGNKGGLNLAKLAKDRAIELARPLNSESLTLHRETVVPILEAKSADIEWMEVRLGVSLAENHSDGDHALRKIDDFFSIAGDNLPALGNLISSNLKSAENIKKLGLEEKFLSLIVAAVNSNVNLMSEIIEMATSQIDSDPEVAARAMDFLFHFAEAQIKADNRASRKGSEKKEN
jgi:hypothetical protein